MSPERDEFGWIDPHSLRHWGDLIAHDDGLTSNDGIKKVHALVGHNHNQCLLERSKPVQQSRWPEHKLVFRAIATQVHFPALVAQALGVIDQHTHTPRSSSSSPLFSLRVEGSDALRSWSRLSANLVQTAYEKAPVSSCSLVERSTEVVEVTGKAALVHKVKPDRSCSTNQSGGAFTLYEKGHEALVPQVVFG